MIPEYKEREFDDQSLSCSNCHWKGKGIDAVMIDFFGVGKNKEAHCPDCDETIAIVKREEGGTPGESANDLSFQTG